MVVPTAMLKPSGRSGPYAEATVRAGPAQPTSPGPSATVTAGHPRVLVAACSNHAFEFAAAYGLCRTAKPLRVLPAAQRGR